MGRHSIPDPDDQPDEESPDLGGGPPDHGPDYGSSGRHGADRGTPETPHYEQPPFRESRYGEPDYRRPEYRGPEYREPEYGRPQYREPEYREPEYGEPEYRRPDRPEPGYGHGGPGGPGYPEAEYPESDHLTDDYANEYDDEYLEEDYPDEEFSRFADGPPPPPSGPSGPQHGGEWDGGEWTGSHRAAETGRRGVSLGVIAALVAVVVLVGAVIVWRFFGDALSDRSATAADRCVDGDLAVAVIADPSIAGQVETLADRYNETASPVADRCVKVGVKPAGTDQVVDGFTGDWPADLGERPALWIPASGVGVARLEAATGPETVSDSESLVTSPVLLAVRPQLEGALAEQDWSTLPRLQSDPGALDDLNLPGWGSLRLALPLEGDSDATYLAAEAVAAASAPPDGPPTAGMGAVNTLMAGQPKLADKKASTAMDALVNAADPAGAPVHAVVTTEQQLFERAKELPDAKNTLASWLPPGPTAVADYPAVALSGDWLSQEQVTAASEFARFLSKPEQLSVLAEAGFRTEGTTPPESDVTTFAPVPAPLSVGDNAMRATLANALTTPANASAVTIMLDTAMPESEGANTRMGNVVNTLIPRIESLAPNSAVGLWTFDGTEGTFQVSTGPLTDPVGGESRTEALTTTLDSLSSTSGGAVSFTTLRLVYNEATSNYVEGKPNSVLVITTGPHTDQTLGGDGLQAFIRDTFDPARPIAVNVIDFGSDSDDETWQAVAETTGGSYQNLASSDSPELTSAITTMLS